MSAADRYRGLEQHTEDPTMCALCAYYRRRLREQERNCIKAMLQADRKVARLGAYRGGDVGRRVRAGTIAQIHAKAMHRVEVALLRIDRVQGRLDAAHGGAEAAP